MNIKRALRVWQRHFKVYTKLYKSSIALNFVEPILYLSAMGFGLGAYVANINGVPYVRFIAPGIIASTAMFAAIYECTYGTFVRMTFQKTFDAILATPVNVDDLITGEMTWGASKSLFYGTILMIVLAAFGLVDSPMIIFLIPVIFLGGLIFAEISLVFVGIVPGIDSFNYFYTLFLTPMLLFSGIFFPLDHLPRIVTTIAWFTPLYHFVNICRAFATGNMTGPILSILWMVAACLLLAPLSFRLMRKRIVK